MFVSGNVKYYICFLESVTVCSSYSKEVGEKSVSIGAVAWIQMIVVGSESHG